MALRELTGLMSNAWKGIHRKRQGGKASVGQVFRLCLEMKWQGECEENKERNDGQIGVSRT